MSIKPEEKFVCKLLEDTIFKGYEFEVGDNIPKGIPDLYSKALKVGIEVTKAELNEDHEYDSKSLKINRSNIHLGKFRNIDYHLVYFRKEIEKKLDKLNKGNYFGCEKVHIVFLNIKRAKSDSQIRKVKIIYDKLVRKYRQSFESLIVITSSNVYSFENNERIIPYEYNDYSQFLQHKLLEIKYP